MQRFMKPFVVIIILLTLLVLGNLILLRANYEMRTESADMLEQCRALMDECEELRNIRENQ